MVSCCAHGAGNAGGGCDELTVTVTEFDVVTPSDTNCCGSAGVYNLLEPDAASALRDRKVANVTQTGAEVLVSSNPGCLLQIASGLEAAGRPMQTRHLVEVLDASMRGTTIG